MLFQRECSSRHPTPQQKSGIAKAVLPGDTPLKVDQYGRRAYSGQWSKDGELVVTTSQDWKIRIYANDSQTLSRRCVINARKGQWTITDVAMSSDSSFLLYSSITPYVHLLPLRRNLGDMDPEADHVVLNFVGAQGSDYSGIWSMALSPDDREIVAGTSDNSVCVYDLTTNQLVERAAAHEEDVNSVCYVETYNDTGSSSRVIASGSDDGLIFLWDKRCMAHPVGVLFGHTEGLTCVSPKGDGQYLLSNSKDQTMKIWDLRRMVDRHCAQPPKRKYVWDYRGMRYPGNPDIDRHPCDLSVSTFRGHSVLRTLVRCAWSPLAWSGQQLVCTGSTDGNVYIFDSSSAQLVRTYNHGNNSSAIVRDLSWHPYLPSLITSAWDGAISLFTTSTSNDEIA